MGRIVIEPVNAPVSVEDLAEFQEELRARLGDEHQIEAKEPLEYRGGVEPEVLIMLILTGIGATAEVVQAIAASVQAWRKRERKGRLPRRIIRFEARTLDEEGRVREFWESRIEETDEK